MADDYDFRGERLLHTLISALELHGIAPNVGLLDSETFPQHKGGTGILVVAVSGQRPKVARLLQQMGCMVRDHRLGVEAHLRGELLPAPELPPVHVTAADSCSAAELGELTMVKRCTGCGAVLPVTAFSWRNREKGWRMPMCPPCDGARFRRWRKARVAAVSQP